MKENKTSAEALIEGLWSKGVREMFGYPGGEVIDVIEAAENRGMPFHLTGHEASAAFMASAIGRLTGRPGACLGTLGPGACNLAVGIGNAFLDRDPMIAISARTGPARENISSKQNISLNDMMAPICKWSVALDGNGTQATVEAGCDLAVRPSKGPVYMTLPGETAIEPDNTDHPGRSPAIEEAVTSSDLGTIASVLSAAKRPIAVVGLALSQQHNRVQIDRFLAETGIPYILTPQGKGAASERLDNFLGVVGTAVGDAEIIPLLTNSDCLLGIGFDSLESYQEWQFAAPIFSIANASTAFRDFTPAEECIGDVGDLIEELGKGLTLSMDWGVSEAKDVHDRVMRVIRPGVTGTAKGLSPLHFLEALRECLPNDVIFTTDVGSNKTLVSQAWETTAPNSFLITNGLASMGYGLPSANAAALLNPDKPVVAVIGDGGFGMSVHELETAKRLGVAPLIVVLYDGALSIIKVAQDQRGLPYRGVHFSPVDWVKVSEGFGAHSVLVNRLEDVQKAVQVWTSSKELTVVVVNVDDALYAGLSY